MSNSHLTLIFNPWYPLALFAMFLQTLFWIQVLKSCHLGIAYPMTSLVFAVNLAFAFFLFGEEVTQFNILGMCLIILGVGLTLKEAS